MANQVIVGSGREHQVAAVGSRKVPKHADHLVIDAVKKEIIEAFIESLENGFASWTVAGGKADAANPRPECAQRRAQEILRLHLTSVYRGPGAKIVFEA